MADERAVIARRQGRAGRITLNRPRALNALDLPMIHAITSALELWRDDPSVHFVVIEGAGERAFCAGGDVRSIRLGVLDEESDGDERDGIESFFVHEYTLNRTIARYPKPYVALIDGLWMGGGVGVSMHGSIRVVSEHAQFAMPEVQIGMFPDVGASFVLPRVRGAFGLYLGLTGARVGGADACWLGLATHFVPRASMAGLADALAEHGLGALIERAERPPPGELPALAAPVAAAFGADSVAAIMAALDRMDHDWARLTLASMRSASPTSLLWTFDLLRAGATRTLEQCQRAELLLTRAAVRHPDFAEGVRAMVIDKDRQPRWSPARLEDIDPDAVAASLLGVG